MIKLNAITLQGHGAPIQNWEIFVNPDHILTIAKEAGKTKIVMSDNQIVHVAEVPSDVVKLIYKSKALFLSKNNTPELPPIP
ncbi:MAG: hypothetical protein A2504_12785 [Bdellovibrionales bacterium RIFOXYD12_FULL_39_22]|nr:MAG: hypothetical protein A2385_03870 [Bdellovibrionales bacterium RIFOXYB1_FULL_39_21]OFZ40490.1 MAG: hypothetical protein A2485_02735 [Bdellovibrionales bacterium RIFOXYC12_FULL_39_17]OFZ49973.1 MAG: hypothetical protein A2404_02070 [Bdellovibrionales bacterium RIFOXYC1_FULL_39_130]OFZ77615.1 MAG: hypothetical protein A2560_04630 [Bdellovibrionales bacterium RIFOXYD1_FULL_39_84]OFZ96069.1 MAG: hypothetical protein A2504_12785 [Bdellovibrionales bacterium RIFOXYD12_FULL_39_22]HLE10642.1 hy